MLDATDEVKEALFGPLEESVKKCLCRKEDILLRREKEKLLAVFVETDRKGAQVIRRRIEEEIKNFLGPGGDPAPVIKVGVATYPEEAVGKRELFQLAKERLMGEKNELEKDIDCG
jgi:GGDEF domain-containing protein